MREAFVNSIMSGNRRGPVAAVLRSLLAGASLFYRAAVTLRNRRFDRGRGVTRVPVPVVSVGNLTAGGTGKTPIVAALANHVRSQGTRVALLSRGYHALEPDPSSPSQRSGDLRQTAEPRNDEGRVLEILCSGIPHYQHPNRVQSAIRAIAERQVELLILDDGFQHRRLARNIDILLIDATNPFGFGHLLPRGLLREPLTGLKRTDIVLLTRADLVSDAVRDEIRRTIHSVAPAVPVVDVAFPPAELINPAGLRKPLTALAGKRVFAFCGIGNPQGFAATLETAGLRPERLEAFPDHHHYSAADLQRLCQAARAADCTAVVTTLKDLVKIPAGFASAAGSLPIWAVDIGVSITANRLAWQALLDRIGQTVGMPFDRSPATSRQAA